MTNHQSVQAIPVRIIKAAVERGATDLHLKAGDVFRARIRGKLVALSKQRLTPEQTKMIALHLVPSEEDRARLDKVRDYDCSWGAPGIGRFRVNILRQRTSYMVVMRVIPFEVPTIEQLQLPQLVAAIAVAERGLVLVAGSSGSGRSSTIAAMIDHMNRTVHRHIITLEDPIEFLHRDLNCSLTQREVGTDTDSYRAGLMAAVRQDPDVVVVGELHDAETADLALKTAETGRLVLSAVDTTDAVSTIGRLVGMFPPEVQPVARVRLADALHAVISQRLLPRKDGKGRAAALDIVIVTPAVRQLIVDAKRTNEVRGRPGGERSELGSQTFDEHLQELVEHDVVDYNTALAAASDPAAFEQRLKAARRRPSPRPAARVAAGGPRPEASAAEKEAAPLDIADDLSRILPS